MQSDNGEIVEYSADVVVVAAGALGSALLFLRSHLDSYCRPHELDNVFVTDGSFFASAGAVNPTLTIIAQTLRVADYIKNQIL